jgi:predicted AlkP superfamily phosphohydrolase/phosphomutase
MSTGFMTRAGSVARRLALAGAATALVACGRPAARQPSDRPAARPPLVVVGIDGGEWAVVRRLWGEGKLPHLRRLAEEGASGVLETAYGASPVIWTTIATGRTPQEHGITDFVVATEAGSVPVSSAVRRVPALWSMASRAGKRTAVLGWWASWPAEEIDGVVVSDRVHLTDDRAVFPAGEWPEVEGAREAARTRQDGFTGGLTGKDPWIEDGAVRDRIVASQARRLAAQGFDLLLAYFRSVDIASHRYWKYFEAERYPGMLRRARERGADVIPTVYEATDRALGEIVAACPTGTNVLVVSDHGFVAGPENPFVFLKTERLLEHLGLLVRDGEAVDFARSVAYPVDSPGHSRLKLLRLSRAGREPGGRITAARADDELDRVARLLESVRYQGGAPVFRVQRTELPAQADLAAEVSLQQPSLAVRVGGETYDDVVGYINSISGTHNATTHGLWVAWGPDIARGAAVEAMSVVDVAPTILYALGLPVADDFAGKARTELFTESFRSRRRLRAIPSWGTMASWRVETSPVDAKIVDELRALGYLSSP